MIDEKSLFLTMQSRHGRKLIWGLLDATNFMTSCFVVSNGDPHYNAFNQGQQNVGLMLYAAIDSACPDLWDVMKREAREDKENDDRAAEQLKQRQQNDFGTGEPDLGDGQNN